MKNNLEQLTKLAEMINNLNPSDFKPTDDDFDYNYLSGEKADEIESFAAGCLIESCLPDIESMRVLKTLCPKIKDIRKGDGDSFGWLTGVIILDDNCAIVYG